MKESIHKYFLIGTLHFASYPAAANGDGPILETLSNILRDEFFSAVEITWMKDPIVRMKAKEMLKVSGIHICYGAQPRLLTTGLNPNDLNEEGRRFAEETLIDAIDEAEYLGADGIAFLAGKYDPDKIDKAFSQLTKTTCSLCSYAKSRGMKAELEIFDYDIDKKALIGPAPLAARFAAEIRQSFDNFGLLLDLSHIPLTHETSQYVISTLRPYITHLHIGNAVIGDPSMEAFGDMHPRFGFPNSANSVNDLANFLKELREEGFFDQTEPMVLSFEVKPWGDEDPEIVIANSKRALNKAWAMLEESCRE